MVVKHFLELMMFSSYQWYYNFAVRVSLKVVWVLQLLAQDPVIIDLTIDSKRQRAVVID